MLISQYQFKIQLIFSFSARFSSIKKFKIWDEIQFNKIFNKKILDKIQLKKLFSSKNLQKIQFKKLFKLKKNSITFNSKFDSKC